MFKLEEYPFVYLDSSYIFRSNKISPQQLTRKFLNQNPQKFNSVLAQIKEGAEGETNYYQKISVLQQLGIISSLISFEVFHEDIILPSSNTVRLFGQYSSLLCEKSPIILWGENVRENMYLKAAALILDATFIVADSKFFSVAVGRELRKYAVNNKKLMLLSNHDNTKETVFAAHSMSPYNFISDLYLSL